MEEKLITELSENLAFIQMLGNNPNFDNNLTADQLKAWFDKAPEAIKKYINTSLIPELTEILEDMRTRVDRMNGQVDDFVVGTGFLPTVGGTMTGAINMNKQKVYGIPAPAAEDEASNKKYVDDTATQILKDLGAEIDSAEDAARNAIAETIRVSSIARGKSSYGEATVTLTAANWANNMQTVSVEGVDSEKTILVGPHPTYHSDYSEAGIYCSGQGDGVLVFNCTKAPKKAITVNVAIFVRGDQSVDTQLEAELLGGAS